MKNHNGSWEPASEHHLLDAQLESLKAGIRKLIERAGTTQTGEPTRIARYSQRVTDLITAHPFAAIAGALGLGYVTARLARPAKS